MPVRALIEAIQARLANERYRQATVITSGNAHATSGNAYATSGNAHARRWQERCGADRTEPRTVPPGPPSSRSGEVGERERPAMLCGRATVPTGVGAVVEIIGGTGLVVPPRNPRALAQACVAPLRDPGRRARPGAAARAALRHLHAPAPAVPPRASAEPAEPGGDLPAPSVPSSNTATS
ncbi:hypothetical protein [Streptomyces sp. NPDC017940]|uniref:hypothetical protein n=1 Tax=Streptomyces sp. NPDC017940 TaxID=3365017 RepID=UPI0037B2827B